MPRAKPLAGRRRPLWLVAALTVLSLGAYIPIWFGLTWAELRRDDADPGTSPLGHALSIFVPGYNAWQASRHFTVANALLERAGVTTRIDPATAAIGLLIWWLTFTHYATDPLFLALDAIELAAGTAVVVYGQRTLNALWAAGGAEERLLETDWLALAVAASYAVITVLAFFASG